MSDSVPGNRVVGQAWQSNFTDKKMTIKENIFIVTALFMAAIYLSSCGKFHTDENGSVSVALSFADKADKGEVTIGDTKLWIFNDGGSLVGSHACHSASELALQRFFLDPGRYLFVTAVNLVEPFTWAESPTVAQDLIFGLEDPLASPSHALYGVNEVVVEDDKSKIVNSEIRRVLSELSLKISGAPAGTSVKATVRSNASGVYPARKDSDGLYGLATDEEVRSITFPQAHEDGGVISTPVLRLMPSTGRSEATIIYLAITLTGGNVLECTILAPPMRPSGKYILTMKYSEMRANMIVYPYKINDWTEGWVVNGEILNPDE